MIVGQGHYPIFGSAKFAEHLRAAIPAVRERGVHGCNQRRYPKPDGLLIGIASNQFNLGIDRVLSSDGSLETAAHAPETRRVLAKFRLVRSQLLAPVDWPAIFYFKQVWRTNAIKPDTDTATSLPFIIFDCDGCPTVYRLNELAKWIVSSLEVSKPDHLKERIDSQIRVGCFHQSRGQFRQLISQQNDALIVSTDDLVNGLSFVLLLTGDNHAAAIISNRLAVLIDGQDDGLRVHEGSGHVVFGGFEVTFDLGPDTAAGGFNVGGRGQDKGMSRISHPVHKTIDARKSRFTGPCAPTDADISLLSYLA